MLQGDGERASGRASKSYASELGRKLYQKERSLAESSKGGTEPASATRSGLM